MYTLLTEDGGREGNDSPNARARARLGEGAEPSGSRRSRLSIWLAITLLAAALAGGAWYVYVRLAAHDSEINGSGGVAALLDTMGGRLSQAEMAQAGARVQIESVKQVAENASQRLQRQLTAGLRQARNSALEMGVALRREMQEAIGSHESRVTARFEELESRRQEEAARAARLEQEVVRLNQRLAAVADDVNNTRAAGLNDARQMREQVLQTNRRVERVASFNNRPRERFEVARGRTQQIAPGIYLHVNKIDPSHRRFHGWLQLVEDGKFLWLRDRSVLQTVAFHAGKDMLRHDLVVTALTPGGVAGYLIFPSLGESEPGASTTMASAQ